MKKVNCRFTASFDVTMEVPDNATPEEIGEELANIEIPENDLCRYLQDSFEPVTDDDGNPKLYGDEGPFVPKALE